MNTLEGFLLGLVIFIVLLALWAVRPTRDSDEAEHPEPKPKL